MFCWCCWRSLCWRCGCQLPVLLVVFVVLMLLLVILVMLLVLSGVVVVMLLGVLLPEKIVGRVGRIIFDLLLELLY